jgi:hypothetical protein
VSLAKAFVDSEVIRTLCTLCTSSPCTLCTSSLVHCVQLILYTMYKTSSTPCTLCTQGALTWRGAMTHPKRSWDSPLTKNKSSVRSITLRLVRGTCPSSAASRNQGPCPQPGFLRPQSGKQVATPSKNTSSNYQVDRTKTQQDTAETISAQTLRIIRWLSKVQWLTRKNPETCLSPGASHLVRHISQNHSETQVRVIWLAYIQCRPVQVPPVANSGLIAYIFGIS